MWLAVLNGTSGEFYARDMGGYLAAATVIQHVANLGGRLAGTVQGPQWAFTGSIAREALAFAENHGRMPTSKDLLGLTLAHLDARQGDMALGIDRESIFQHLTEAEQGAVRPLAKELVDKARTVDRETTLVELLGPDTFDWLVRRVTENYVANSIHVDQMAAAVDPHIKLQYPAHAKDAFLRRKENWDLALDKLKRINRRVQEVSAKVGRTYTPVRFEFPALYLRNPASLAKLQKEVLRALNDERAANEAWQQSKRKGGGSL